MGDQRYVRQGVKEAESECRRIWQKWRERKLI